jgi:hypothetical protein
MSYIQPRLDPYNFHIFGPLKKAFKGGTITSDNDMQEAVVQWYRQQSKEFFADGKH